MGAESQFYGYSGDDKPAPTDASEYMLKLCRLYAQNGVRVLATDYCLAASDVDASYRRSKENGFICFAADKRNLTATPKYPNAPHNVNGKDIKTVWDAENCLRLINSEKFSTKRQLIDALKNKDYDMDLFHFEKAYAESEVRELKTKRDGGKLLVICWRGRGLPVLLEWRLENRQAQLASRGKPALERKLCRQILGCGLAKNNYGKRRLVSKKDFRLGF